MTPLPVSGERPERCETCRFWVDERTGVEPPEVLAILEDGECHRFPPPVLAWADDTCESRFPHTGAGDWCGEWAARTPAPSPRRARRTPP